jgi:hypothetical protein
VVSGVASSSGETPSHVIGVSVQRTVRREALESVEIDAFAMYREVRVRFVASRQSTAHQPHFSREKPALDGATSECVALADKTAT